MLKEVSKDNFDQEVVQSQKVGFMEMVADTEAIGNKFKEIREKA